jgi:two-component system LytT family response regulator
MSKTTVIIVDDEPNAQLLIKSMLSQYSNEIEIVGEAANVPEAVKIINQKKPDVVFLDIEMPGYSGLELLDFFDKESINFNIIFVTAYSDYAINAFEQSAVDYLLKPLKKEHLDRAVQRILKEKHAFTAQLENAIAINDKLAVQSSEGLLLINPTDICYLKADGSYTHIVMHGGKKITVSKNLSELSKLEAKGYFVRVHRSYVVNINYVTKILKQDRGVIVMTDGTEISVSQDRKQELYNIVEQFRI